MDDSDPLLAELPLVPSLGLPVDTTATVTSWEADGRTEGVGGGAADGTGGGAKALISLLCSVLSWLSSMPPSGVMTIAPSLRPARTTSTGSGCGAGVICKNRRAACNHWVTNVLAEERVRFDPPTEVERQHAVAAAEAGGEPERGEGTGRKDENIVHGGLEVHVELVELSNAVHREKQIQCGKRQKDCHGVNDGPTAREQHNDNGDEDDHVMICVQAKSIVVANVANGIIDVVVVSEAVQGDKVHENSVETTSNEPQKKLFPIEQQAVLAVEVQLRKLHDFLGVKVALETGVRHDGQSREKNIVQGNTEVIVQFERAEAIHEGPDELRKREDKILVEKVANEVGNASIAPGAVKQNEAFEVPGVS